MSAQFDGGSRSVRYARAHESSDHHGDPGTIGWRLRARIDDVASVGRIAVVTRTNVVDGVAGVESFSRSTASGEIVATPPLASGSISRKQLEIWAADRDCIVVRNIGRCPLLQNGAPVSHAEFRAGDTLQLGKQLLFIVVRRPAVLPGGCAGYPDFEFGQADPHGIVGESAAAWRLRGQIAFLARQEGHLLISGPSGAGKELVAQAIHSLSKRGNRRMVARNAATLPEGLIDAELFRQLQKLPEPRHGRPPRSRRRSERLEPLSRRDCRARAGIPGALATGARQRRIPETGRGHVPSRRSQADCRHERQHLAPQA